MSMYKESEKMKNNRRKTPEENENKGGKIKKTGGRKYKKWTNRRERKGKESIAVGTMYFKYNIIITGISREKQHGEVR